MKLIYDLDTIAAVVELLTELHQFLHRCWGAMFRKPESSFIRLCYADAEQLHFRLQKHPLQEQQSAVEDVVLSEALTIAVRDRRLNKRRYDELTKS